MIFIPFQLYSWGMKFLGMVQKQINVGNTIYAVYGILVPYVLLVLYVPYVPCPFGLLENWLSGKN